MLVPDSFRKCVVFIGTKTNGRFTPRATGFLVSIFEEGLIFYHLVTAEHVVWGLKKSGEEIWLRTNLISGGATELQIINEDWMFHPDKANEPTDVAVCILEPAPDDDLVGLPLNGPSNCAATLDVIRRMNIGAGDETVIIGLFRSHYGQERNMPIVRVGNLSALLEERVFTKYCGYTDAYLVEARSIGGLSGSPVLVNNPPYKVIGGTIFQATGLHFYLLGLMHGHFDVENINEDAVVDDKSGSSGINTGIGVVIPVEKIIETVDQPRLRTLRREAIERFRAKGLLPTGADKTGPAAQESQHGAERQL